MDITIYWSHTRENVLCSMGRKVITTSIIMCKHTQEEFLVTATTSIQLNEQFTEWN